MKPKTITTHDHVVAALDGARPRYLCRDARHGHWVVTLDASKATSFASQAQAVEAARDYLRLGFGVHHTRAGDWRAYCVTRRATFTEAATAPA